MDFEPNTVIRHKRMRDVSFLTISTKQLGVENVVYELYGMWISSSNKVMAYDVIRIKAEDSGNWYKRG